MKPGILEKKSYNKIIDTTEKHSRVIKSVLDSKIEIIEGWSGVYSISVYFRSSLAFKQAIVIEDIDSWDEVKNETAQIIADCEGLGMDPQILFCNPALNDVTKFRKEEFIKFKRVQ